MRIVLNVVRHSTIQFSPADKSTIAYGGRRVGYGWAVGFPSLVLRWLPSSEPLSWTIIDSARAPGRPVIVELIFLSPIQLYIL